jgi:hypothetical protein
VSDDKLDLTTWDRIRYGWLPRIGSFAVGLLALLLVGLVGVPLIVAAATANSGTQLEQATEPAVEPPAPPVTVVDEPPAPDMPPAPPEVVSEPVVEIPVAPEPQREPEPYYENCTAVRAAGAAPIYPDDPGWQDKFDGDNNGIGCE